MEGNMIAPQSKKPLILNILDNLKRYTDEEHRPSQKFAEILKKEYGMTADRKAIGRNLINLMEFKQHRKVCTRRNRRLRVGRGFWGESQRNKPEHARKL